jgi:superfamily I DNA/RNA helicase
MTVTGFQRARSDASSVTRHELDADQLAVLALPDDASAAVIGAPGTGKTSTLVELVADRVERAGFLPEQVVALTASRTTATR